MRSGCTRPCRRWRYRWSSWCVVPEPDCCRQQLRRRPDAARSRHVGSSPQPAYTVADQVASLRARLRRRRHPEEPLMPIPKHVFDPPFNIVRSSHVALGVADLGRARAFYEGALGLIVEDEDTGALYLRALEERQHHSLVLMKSRVAEAHHLGFKVGSEEDLDKAARFFKGKGLRHAFA